MKALSFVTVLLVLLFGQVVNAQDSVHDYRFSVASIGAFPVDDIAGTNRAGIGVSFQVDRKVGDHWTVGVSYYATKIWGRADYANFEIDAYDLTSRYYVNKLGETKNLYLILNSGWAFVNQENVNKQDDLTVAFGGGFQYMVYKNVSLDAGVMIRKNSDKVDSINPYLSLIVPILN